MLQTFQQMSFSCDFEECLYAFCDEKLNDDQLEQLKLIHKLTTPWTLGHATTAIVNRINSIATSGKDVKEMTQALTEILRKDSNRGPNGNAGFNVNLYSPRNNVTNIKESS